MELQSGCTHGLLPKLTWKGWLGNSRWFHRSGRRTLFAFLTFQFPLCFLPPAKSNSLVAPFPMVCRVAQGHCCDPARAVGEESHARPSRCTEVLHF